MISRSCPKCGSHSIRGSQRQRISESWLRLILIRPSRCRECHFRFFRFSPPFGQLRAGVQSYSRKGRNGADPGPGQGMGGTVAVEEEPGLTSATHNRNQADTHPDCGAAADSTKDAPQYAWSKKSNIYHYANCFHVSNISPGNLQHGNFPRAGQTCHEACPVVLVPASKRRSEGSQQADKAVGRPPA